MNAEWFLICEGVGKKVIRGGSQKANVLGFEIWDVLVLETLALRLAKAISRVSLSSIGRPEELALLLSSMFNGGHLRLPAEAPEADCSKLSLSLANWPSLSSMSPLLWRRKMAWWSDSRKGSSWSPS